MNKLNDKTKKTLKIVSISIFIIILILYVIFSFIASLNKVDQLYINIQCLLITITAILFILSILLNQEKFKKYILYSLSITFSLFLITSILNDSNIFKLPSKATILDFKNKQYNEAVSFCEKNNIKLIESYEHSDTIPIYNIIRQNIYEGALLKDITELEVVISSGPDYEKDVIIPNLLGKTNDEILSFIKENFLNNVTVDFIVSDMPKDTLIEQSFSGQMKRNSELKLVFSIGTESDIVPTIIGDLSNNSLFEAIFLLKSKGFKYEISYDFSNSVLKGNVISQSTDINIEYNPKETTVTLVISKGKEIIVPEIINKKSDEILKWIIDNNLQIKFSDKYDDSIAAGLIIECNYKTGDKIEEGTEISIVVSKGSLKMESFNNIADFKTWADKYSIKYSLEYEFNSLSKDSIISFSKNINETIKNNETIIAKISKGEAVTIPNFVGMTRSQIASKCNELGISANFTYGSYSDSIAKDVATAQNVASGTQVERSSSITITLCRGKQVKVIVPNFVGMTKSQAQSKANSLGLKISFVYGGLSDSIAKDVVTNQSIATNSSVLPNTTIKITLSSGIRKTYVLQIPQSYFKTGSSATTVRLLKEYLSKNYPEIKFNVYAATPSVDEQQFAPGMYLPSKSNCVAGQTISSDKTYTIAVKE